MSKKDPAYENLYTKQMEEAVSEQHKYDAEKEKQKVLIKKQNRTTGIMVKSALVMIGLGLLIGLGYVINLDPANAGPSAVLFSVFLAVCGIFWFMSR